jgi:hypothetical protein
MRRAPQAIRPPDLPGGLAHAEVAALEALDLEGARVEGAALTQQRAGRVRLDGVHLVRSALIGPADVRGLIVSREQAAVLAQLFGLVLREPV